MNNDRFFLERKNDTRTFPIFDDETPLAKRNLWWLIVLPPLIFAIVVIPQILWPDIDTSTKGVVEETLIVLWQDVMPLILFILMLHELAGRSLRSFFKKLTWHDIGDGAVALVLGNLYAIITSLTLTAISKNLVAANITTGSFKAGMPKSELTTNLIREVLTDIPSLLCEELLAIIPMLAAATLAYRYYGQSRKNSIWIGLLVSIFVFGLAHFSAYDWHLAQMFIVIGMSRLFDTGVYIRTKNLWVSYISHYLWDTVSSGILFLIAMNK
ncbi:CPBP family intramembrane metalloprotease [Lentilactobacillus senioris]|uniref:CPBP family intramembrane glutamic endopeptidase n=1 Tax=Lentilactobacillus senioris TaxID=931534 RepID=UPI00227E1D37|nr:CPBP family intramembrane glutamic endopeptidase [Lentilactobacillus senioris]MCY9806277.1 CPBP family intramembrane metalloprotease [Lentilactobacillus senioris]